MQGASYPEMEVLWLLTKSWNCGIHQYRWFNMPHYIFPSPSTLSAGEALSPSCCFYPILKVSSFNLPCLSLSLFFPTPSRSVQHYKEAEQWCGMGMRFLKFLTQLKSSYEEQVSRIFVNPLADKRLTL